LLIERCRQGDETAFRELVDQYKGLIFALIARSITNRARVEELAQDVFLKVHKGLPYFRGDAKLSTWIYRIAINVLAAERPGTGDRVAR
jgi:RNA polymerase sigma-70 factor (ECF subfamily)